MELNRINASEKFLATQLASRSEFDLVFPFSDKTVEPIGGGGATVAVSSGSVQQQFLPEYSGYVGKIKAYAEVGTAFLSGLSGQLIKVEAGLLPGLPFFDVVGLPDRSIKEALKRVRSALLSLGEKMPRGQVTVNLAPAELAKSGSVFDLPIALTVLALSSAKPGLVRLQPPPAVGQTPSAGLAAVGELGLNGDVLPVRGVFGIVAALLEAGYQQIIVPARQQAILRFFGHDRLIGVSNLQEAAVWCGLRGGLEEKNLLKQKSPAAAKGADHEKISRGQFFNLPGTVEPTSALLNIATQVSSVRGLACALAGGHHALLVGSPGSGKSVMAGLCAALLPPLTAATALRVLSTYSATYPVEDLPTGRPVPPVRAPHHTITEAGLRGSRLYPGEISLADGGVLFFDELAEASPAVIKILRQPLEDGFIRLIYRQQLHIFPAKFIFIGAANPCPCGLRYERDGRCQCTPAQKKLYVEKLKGPLGDRISLFIETGSSLDKGGGDYSGATSKKKLNGHQSELLDMVKLRRKIGQARLRQAHRNGRIKGEVCLNADLNPVSDREKFLLSPGAVRLLDSYSDQFQLSVRSRHNLLKAARTFADLDQSDSLLPDHLMEAAFYRRFS